MASMFDRREVENLTTLITDHQGTGQVVNEVRAPGSAQFSDRPVQPAPVAVVMRRVIGQPARLLFGR